MTNPEVCDHPRLFFGAGGYRIICSSCGTTWAAEGEFQGKKSLNENDVRVTTAGVLVKGDDNAGS